METDSQILRLINMAVKCRISTICYFYLNKFQEIIDSLKRKLYFCIRF